MAGGKDTVGDYRWASVVKVEPPLYDNDGVWVFAGKVDDGAEWVREVDGETERVTLELIERFHADERMTEQEAVQFGKNQSEEWGQTDER